MITKNGIIEFVKRKKRHIENDQKRDKENVEWIENYIVNVINKDKHYYKHLRKFVEDKTIKEEELKYCM